MWDQGRIVKSLTRRYFFNRLGVGIGAAALASLFDRDLLPQLEGGPSGVRPSDFPARAKRLVYLFMSGGPSQVDLFDPKPALQRHHGESLPKEVIGDQRFAFIKDDFRLQTSPYKFRRHGHSGAEVSDLLPHLGELVDDIAIVRSVHTEAFNHDPAQMMLNTGSLIPGRPSMGAWTIYGIGSESRDLPAFVVLVSGQGQPLGSHLWGSGFLPTVYQGVRFRSVGDAVPFLSNPSWINSANRRETVDAINDLNRMQLDWIGDPEIETRIEAFELAFRMQSSVPELMDIQSEPPSVHEAYGSEPGKASFANNCLLARRLLERGVRYVQLFHRGWDHHALLEQDLPQRCLETDRPVAALLKDLKQRGLLQDTLVVWGGEFGRTPMVETHHDSWGRDHNPRAFTTWLAGGGIKPGITYGTTDDFSYNVVENPVHVHDLQATILHCLGLDHTRLVFRHRGRNFRLTDIGGRVIKTLLA